MQNGFISEVSRPVVPVIADIVKRWQSNGGDTLFTRYFNYDGSPFERLINWRKLREAPETDIVDELVPLAENATAIIDKRVYTLFNNEGAALISQHGWRELYICGIDTESCVLKTAVDAFERDLTPWVLTDACASHSSEEAHRTGLLVTSKFIGPKQIIRSADVPCQLLPS